MQRLRSAWNCPKGITTGTEKSLCWPWKAACFWIWICVFPDQHFDRSSAGDKTSRKTAPMGDVYRNRKRWFFGRIFHVQMPQLADTAGKAAAYFSKAFCLGKLTEKHCNKRITSLWSLLCGALRYVSSQDEKNHCGKAISCWAVLHVLPLWRSSLVGFFCLSQLTTFPNLEDFSILHFSKIYFGKMCCFAHSKIGETPLKLDLVIVLPRFFQILLMQNYIASDAHCRSHIVFISTWANFFCNYFLICYIISIEAFLMCS